MNAQGVLDGDTVHVADTAHANRLHNKGFVGTPETGNSLRLTLVEAIHCIHAGRLDVAGHDSVSLLRQAASDGEQTEIDHLAYHDLRERGLVVRPRDGCYDVWRRGEGPKNEPWFTTRVYAERHPITADDLADGPGMVSVVDEDGGVIHYEVAAAAPKGDVLTGDLPTMAGVLLDDRVLVAGDGADGLAHEHMGTVHPNGRVLSLIEAESLRRRGTLDVDPELPTHAAARQPHFHATLAAYDALRAAGVVARSGFRFGTHLRGYSTDPDKVHAEWLLHCVRPDETMTWSDLSRAIRLAHGVRKTFLVASATDPIRFTALSWFRP